MLLLIVAVSLLISLSPNILLSGNSQRLVLKKSANNKQIKINRQRNLAVTRNQPDCKDNEQTQQDLLNYAYSQLKKHPILDSNDEVVQIIHELETKRFQSDLVLDGLSQVCDIMGSQTEKKRKRRFFNILGLILRVVAQMAKK